MDAKRLLFTAKAKCELASFELPQKPGQGELLLETLCSVVSPGTETNLFLGAHSGFDDPENKWTKYPMRPGYGSCCRVLEVGPGVEGFEKGMKVFCIEPHASTLLLPASKVFRAPDGLAPEEACFAKLMAISMNGVRVSAASLGESVGVFGQGLIGLFATAFAKMSGAFPLLAVDMNPKRLELSRLFGADETLNPLDEPCEEALKRLLKGKGLACAIEASGNSALIPECARSLAMGGRLILLGSPHRDISMNFYKEIHCKQISVTGAHEAGAPKTACHQAPWTMPANIELSLALAAKGALPLGSLITHRFKPEEAQEMYSRIGAREQGMLGVVIDWQASKGSVRERSESMMAMA